ncbi:hypothetical protein LOTGIDRAFT_125538 [Lottia gigantea]|uniref:Heme-binding protein 2 n=1 Tax=Lottia gigantea TaxID=225164 RepID=V4BK13_LOTGI|nr:hypothetical protein LOTGIDRAFT_125538 [Lottia gigantea]ESO88879.1 hypothetical protein LOTGIDRAFT_125538 [Lottia gigantea]
MFTTDLNKQLLKIFLSNYSIKNILLPGPAITNTENLNQKPDFCNKLDCPKFEVVKDVKDKYQIRQYEPSKWVMTEMLGVNYEDAKKKMFMKLFEYIQGKNVKDMKIEMTAPVLMRLIPGQGPACDNNFTMAFYVSNSVPNPPKAKDSTVYLKNYPKFKAFVRSFPGYITEEKDFIEETRKLITYLNGTSLDKSYFITAGYNSPFQLLDRHNEVWLFP